jgi:hypothetical protein
MAKKRRRLSPSPVGGIIKQQHHPLRPQQQPPLRAVERYVTEPMLCEFVYKAKQQQQLLLTLPKQEDNEENNNNNNNLLQVKQEQTDLLQVNQEQEQTELDDEQPALTPSYTEYCKTYALNYIRAFFNEHMDDTWFRNRYSPLMKRRLLEDEFDRAASEAKAMMEAMALNPDEFVQHARLGHGVKNMNSTNADNAIPKVHTFDHLHIVKLMEIPHYVTEEQLVQALLTPTVSASAMHIYSNTISHETLLRDAVCVFATKDAKDAVLSHLAKHSVPRKEGKSLSLTVECSDPYGRSTTTTSTTTTTTPAESRQCHVLVSIEPMTTTVQVLSVSLSSMDRIPNDRAAAIHMGRALDVKRKIPRNYRLEDLMDQCPHMSDEDGLDVAIAYLRRVHLFSFYNACSFGESFVKVWNGQTPAGVVHLRLQGADALLHPAAVGSSSSSTSGTTTTDTKDQKTDLLVQRLDDAILKSMEAATSDWVNGEYIMSYELDAQAKELEVLEQQTQQEWVKQHILVDGEDGRARCGYPFCRKLFKDGSFLKKHLFKKHSEYLRAEVAQCHDAFMMRAWEEEEVRPIPPILVDCGTNFGLKPSTVVGAIPMVEDPEPELWRQEEERRKKSEEKEEMRNRRRDEQMQQQQQPNSMPRRAPNTFVDVDDMKEEKVELKFDTVDIPIEAPKKKRKKLL